MERLLQTEFDEIDPIQNSYNKKFIQLFNVEQLNTLFSDQEFSAHSQRFLTSCIFDQLHRNPVEFAQSAFFNAAFDNHAVLCEINKERVRGALLNGKNTEVLNYLYNDFPQKQLSKYCHEKSEATYFDQFGYIENDTAEERTTSHLYETLKHFAIPTQKTLQSISAAYEALVDIKENHICEILNAFYNSKRYPDFSYKLGFNCFNLRSSYNFINATIIFDQEFIFNCEPQTEEGYQYKAEIIHDSFYADYLNKEKYQNYFRLDNGTLYADFEDTKLNAYVDQVFNFENLSLNETISIFRDIRYRYDDAPHSIYRTDLNYTKQLLNLSQDLNKENRSLVFSYCSMFIDNHFHHSRFQEAFDIINHPNFIHLFRENNNFDLNIDDLVKSQNVDLLKKTFNYLNYLVDDNSYAYVYDGDFERILTDHDFENLKNEIKVELEKQVLAKELEHF
jgi:hypothetical protein